MKKSKDLSSFKLHTDLAIEKAFKISPKTYREKIIKHLKITEMVDRTQQLTATIEFTDVSDAEARFNLSQVLTITLKRVLRKLKLAPKAKCLVVGLGNKASIPDALGPKVLEEVIVTAHLFALPTFSVDPAYRSVASLAPGVMASTGIEALTLVKAVIKQIKPDFLLVIDSLVANDLAHVNKVVQITTKGITPGSGIGLSNMALTKASLGVPVIALGVPTIIEASTIVNNTLRHLITHFPEYAKLQSLDQMSKGEVEKLLNQTLNLGADNLMVTPKEIDFVIKHLAQVIAKGINESLHDLK